MHTTKRTANWLFITFLVAASHGCTAPTAQKMPRRFEYQEEAGSCHVAVLSVARWEDARDLLQPGFKLAPDDAVKLAVPNSLTLEEKILSASGISAKAGFNQGSPVDPSKIAFEASPAGSQTAGALGPANSVTATPIAIDPVIQYQVATALFEEVQLLNRYVKDAAVADGYVPYLVRLQVSVVPSAHNEPYDVLSTLAFFNGDFDLKFGSRPIPYNGNLALINHLLAVTQTQKDKNPRALLKEAREIFRDRPSFEVSRATTAPAVSSKVSEKDRKFDALILEKITSEAESAYWGELDPDLAIGEIKQQLMRVYRVPRVVPLLVTDDLQSALHSSSNDQIRRVAGALSIAVQGLGGSVDAQKVDEKLRTILGKDFNSTFTLSRLSENSIRARFGAQYEADTQYVTVPQTHTVTLLVLADEELVTGKSIASRRFRVMAGTHFEDGEEPSQTPKSGGPSKTHAQNALLRFETKPGSNLTDKIVNDLMTAFQFGDFDAFAVITNNTFQNASADAVWVTIAQALIGNEFSEATFSVPPPADPKLMPIASNQTVTVIDDGKTAMKAVMIGIRDPAPSEFVATINCRLADKKPDPKSSPLQSFVSQLFSPVVTLSSQKAEISNSSNAVTFTFPSIKALGKYPEGPARFAVYRKPVWPNQGFDNMTSLAGLPPTGLGVVYVVKSADSFNLIVRAKTILAHPDGTGDLQLTFVGVPAGDKIVVSVDGADLKPAPEAAPSDMIKADEKKLTIQKDGLLTLHFSNLDPSSPITVSAKDENVSAGPFFVSIVRPGQEKAPFNPTGR